MYDIIIITVFYVERAFMERIVFNVGDVLLMKKKHPCSADTFKVMRGGTDVRVVCQGCGRDMTIERTALEKMIKKVITEDKKEN